MKKLEKNAQNERKDINEKNILKKWTMKNLEPHISHWECALAWHLV